MCGVQTTLSSCSSGSGVEQRFVLVHVDSSEPGPTGAQCGDERARLHQSGAARVHEERSRLHPREIVRGDGAARRGIRGACAPTRRRSPRRTHRDSRRPPGRGSGTRESRMPRTPRGSRTPRRSPPRPWRCGRSRAGRASCRGRCSPRRPASARAATRPAAVAGAAPRGSASASTSCTWSFQIVTSCPASLAKQGSVRRVSK